MNACTHRPIYPAYINLRTGLLYTSTGVFISVVTYSVYCLTMVWLCTIHDMHIFLRHTCILYEIQVHASYNPLSTRPHQNVVWYNNSWLGFLKILNYVPKEREQLFAKNEPSFGTVKCCDGSWIGTILDKIICEFSNWQHIQTLQRLKITILGADWQLFRLERIAN